LVILLAQQNQDIRQRAQEPVPTLLPTAQGNGSISGYVYEDKNQNAERDPDEKVLPGVSLKVTEIRKSISEDQGKVANTVSDLKTDSNGFFKFRFTNLIPDSTSYIVKLILPKGYKTISTNPVVFSGRQKNAKEIVEFGLFPIPSVPISIAPSPSGQACTPRPPCISTVPKCFIPEPVGGWCPAVTIYPTSTPTPPISSKP